MEPIQEDESLFSKIKKNAVELIEYIAITGAIVVVLHFFIAEPHEVSGTSMVPNFNNKDYIITNKIGMRLSEPQKGEVLIIKNPKSPKVVLIKRLVGMPGDKIKLLNGQVYVNNQALVEPYLKSGIRTQGESFLGEGEEIEVPAGQYFVLGDNRQASSDSREFGPVPKDLIIGQAWLRYWPLNKFGIIPINKPS